MCTVSWLHGDSGYHLFCNRDEKRTRARALPPAVYSRRGIRYIAPIDGERGGTWLAVNELGLTVGLLNGYATPHNDTLLLSRGMLIPELISESSALEAVRRAAGMELGCYAPFVLVALEQRFPARLLVWDGRDKVTVANGDAFMPLVSSSFDAAGVCTSRRAWLRSLRSARGVLDAALLRDFHASHGAGASAFSPCMHRPDAETVSFSEISVSDTSVQLSYTPSAPCLQAPELTLALPRNPEAPACPSFSSSPSRHWCRRT